MSLHVGLGLFTGQVPPGHVRSVAEEYEDILALARVAEAVGFDSLWVSEHHGAADSYLPSLPVMLAAVAAVTKRLLLGTAVVLGPFQHPLRFAEDCAVLDQLSRGRLIVGIGAGWREEEFRAFGVPRAERAGRTSELVKICRAAWAQETFSFQGRYFSYENVCVTPKPFGHLRVLLGGTAPVAIERAGRLADGYIGTPQNRIEEFRRDVGLFDHAARVAGRDADRLALGFHVNAWVSPDGAIPASVRRAMWHQIGTYMAWRAGETPGHPSSTLPTMDDEVIVARAFAGTPAKVVAQARPWVEEFGHRELHVIMRLHYPGMQRESAEQAMRLFGADVIPHLKRLAEAVRTHGGGAGAEGR
jgi:probable F420-dependent oxidoreductase